MQKIFIEKPYRFVRPIMQKWVPWLFNTKLIHAPLLRFTESIVSVESRGADRLKKSINAGHAVMMIGNHPRVSDPVTIFDLIRHANTTVFCMASWHLFNQSWFHTAVIRLYGAYSINREGLDRESVNFSINALQKNIRPVLMFPEGATTRTNDSLMPFLDGPVFIARTAARRRQKQGLKTVIHPIVFRYVFTGDFNQEFGQLIEQVEKILNLSPESNASPAKRIRIAIDALVSRKELEFGIEKRQHHNEFERRQHLANEVMAQAEVRCFGKRSDKDITNRIREVRTAVYPELLNDHSLDTEERAIRWRDLERTYLAWQIASYPDGYLSQKPSNDRLLEIAAKILEDLTDKPRVCGKQKVIIECCDPIDVPASKHRGATPDPLQTQIESAIRSKLQELER